MMTNDDMEQRIRDYFAACNTGDAERIAAHFTDDGVHYFPAGSPFGALRGAQAIGECWAHCVATLGSHWTVDHYLGDTTKCEAVIEWTHNKPKVQQVLRGDEWYRFNEAGLITEIRAYYACPTHAGVSEHGLGDFDYSGRGYPTY